MKKKSFLFMISLACLAIIGCHNTKWTPPPSKAPEDPQSSRKSQKTPSFQLHNLTYSSSDKTQTSRDSSGHREVAWGAPSQANTRANAYQQRTVSSAHRSQTAQLPLRYEVQPSSAPTPALAGSKRLVMAKELYQLQRQHMGELRRCFEKAHNNPSFEELVERSGNQIATEVKVTIDDAGKVLAVAMDIANKAPDFAVCLARSIQNWTFPAVGQQTVVFPIQFKGVGFYKKASLSEKDVAKGLKRVFAGVRLCYERFKKPGRYEIEITINGQGAAARAKPVGARKDPQTAACICQAVVAMARFPKFRGKDIVITYPFVIQ